MHLKNYILFIKNLPCWCLHLTNEVGRGKKDQHKLHPEALDKQHTVNFNNLFYLNLSKNIRNIYLLFLECFLCRIIIKLYFT